mmetsp:Transcript_18264/g.47715  ORF Transcript_18264/g.47715 Transcript_18264/m.47715 type:complete len:220 (-) Transcript_18264:939-1598(-)
MVGAELRCRAVGWRGVEHGLCGMHWRHVAVGMHPHLDSCAAPRFSHKRQRHSCCRRETVHHDLSRWQVHTECASRAVGFSGRRLVYWRGNRLFVGVCREQPKRHGSDAERQTCSGSFCGAFARDLHARRSACAHTPRAGSSRTWDGHTGVGQRQRGRDGRRCPGCAGGGATAASGTAAHPDAAAVGHQRHQGIRGGSHQPRCALRRLCAGRRTRRPQRG